eukprot:5749940-Pyramimonas_sp.AAC.1
MLSPRRVDLLRGRAFSRDRSCSACPASSSTATIVSIRIRHLGVRVIKLLKLFDAGFDVLQLYLTL